MADYTKVDDNTLKVEKVETLGSTYDYNFLLNQKARLEKELAEVDALIVEADKLGITTKVEVID